jgi:hypothetical protein
MWLPITLGSVTSARPSEFIPHKTASIKPAVKIPRFIVALSQEVTVPETIRRDDQIGLDDSGLGRAVPVFTRMTKSEKLMTKTAGRQFFAKS